MTTFSLPSALSSLECLGSNPDGTFCFAFDGGVVNLSIDRRIYGSYWADAAVWLNDDALGDPVCYERTGKLIWEPSSPTEQDIIAAATDEKVAQWAAVQALECVAEHLDCADA